MDNKKNLIIVGVLGGVFLITAIVFYLQKNSLLGAINRLHEESQTVRSLEELQQKVNDFFAATNVSTVSFLRSKASGTSGIAITGIKEKSVSVGSKVTVTGLGLNLPAFAVIDGDSAHIRNARRDIIHHAIRPRNPNLSPISRCCLWSRSRCSGRGYPRDAHSAYRERFRNSKQWLCYNS